MRELNELYKSYLRGRLIYQTSKLLSSNESEKDIIKYMSKLYKSNTYMKLSETDLRGITPKDVKEMYIEERKMV